jgi:hypothetical protein
MLSKSQGSAALLGRRRPLSYGKSFNFLLLCRMRHRHPGRSRFFGGAFIFHSANFSPPLARPAGLTLHRALL